jgi:plasmid replication initiation protein
VKKHQAQPPSSQETTLTLVPLQTVDAPPSVVGKDEMNLAEYPFTLLTPRLPPGSKTFTLTQQIRDAHGKSITQTWAVLGSDKYGLPTPYDDDVLLALLYCYKSRNSAGKRISFTLYELCRIMQRPPSQQEYARLRVALNRLISTTIAATNCFYDNLAHSWVSESFHLFERYRVYHEQKRRAAAPPLSFIEMSEVFYRSVALANYIKNLNLDLYYRLTSATSKRLFRYLDKNRYQKAQYEEGLVKLARKLPLQAAYPSQIKQKLARAHTELQQQGYLATVTYAVTPQGEHKVTYTFAAPPALDSSLPAVPTLTAAQLVRDFYSQLTGQAKLPYTPTSKELAMAEEYLTTYGPACAAFLVRHALKAAKATGFSIQTFGGTQQFLASALAAWATQTETAAREAAAQEAAREQAELAHACEQTQARVAEALAGLSAAQRQQLEQRAQALVAGRESDFGYRIMFQFACEDLVRQEYLGFDRWPQLVAQVRARTGTAAGDDVLQACRLEALLDDVLVVSVPTAEAKVQLHERYLGLLEDLASLPPHGHRIRVLARHEPPRSA